MEMKWGVPGHQSILDVYQLPTLRFASVHLQRGWAGPQTLGLSQGHSQEPVPHLRSYGGLLCW